MPKYRNYKILSTIYKNHRTTVKTLTTTTNTSTPTITRTITQLNQQYNDIIQIKHDKQGYYISYKKPQNQLQISQILHYYFTGAKEAQIISSYFRIISKNKITYEGYYTRKQITTSLQKHNLPTINNYKTLNINTQKYIITQIIKSSTHKYIEQHQTFLNSEEVYGVTKQKFIQAKKLTKQITKQLLRDFDPKTIYSTHYYTLYTYVLIETLLVQKQITYRPYNNFNIKTIPHHLNPKILNTIFIFDFDIEYATKTHTLQKEIPINISSIVYKLQILQQENYIKTTHIYNCITLNELKGNTYGLYNYLNTYIKTTLNPQQELAFYSQYLGTNLQNLNYSPIYAIKSEINVDDYTLESSNSYINCQQDTTNSFELHHTKAHDNKPYYLNIKYNTLNDLILHNTALLNTTSPIVSLKQHTLIIISNKNLPLISYTLFKLKRNFPNYKIKVYPDIYYLSNITKFIKYKNLYSISPIKSPLKRNQILPLLPSREINDNYTIFIK